jgi:hypothetical protein
MKQIIITAGALMVVFLLGALLSLQTGTANGSVQIGSEYQATTTTSAWASSTAAREVINGGNSAITLGSIVIASSSPITTLYQVAIYDATSTMATATSRLITKIGPNNQTHGTYEYDVNLKYGLLVETTTGFNGNFTITYR